MDDIEKIKRLRQWCADVNAVQKDKKYKALYIKQDDWEKLGKKPRLFTEIQQIGSRI